MSTSPSIPPTFPPPASQSQPVRHFVPTTAVQQPFSTQHFQSEAMPPLPNYPPPNINSGGQRFILTPVPSPSENFQRPPFQQQQPRMPYNNNMQQPPPQMMSFPGNVLPPTPKPKSKKKKPPTGPPSAPTQESPAKPKKKKSSSGKKLSATALRIRAEHERYGRKHYLLKRCIKALVFKNGALCDEVARLKQRILTVTKEREILVKRLFHHERLKQRKRQNAEKRAQLAAAVAAANKHSS